MIIKYMVQIVAVFPIVAKTVSRVQQICKVENTSTEACCKSNHQKIKY